jgi:uncharacterized protein (DUF488 family)
LTIGGYGFTEPRFLEKLVSAEVDTFADVRQRRGVRGSQYAFLNSTRLQAHLASAGIRYVHIPELAPTTEIREQQKARDLASHTSKKGRRQLAPEFTEAYQRLVLQRFGRDAFPRIAGDAKAVAFFCVEARPEACHRSLAAAHVAAFLGIRVENLLP